MNMNEYKYVIKSKDYCCISELKAFDMHTVVSFIYQYEMQYCKDISNTTVEIYIKVNGKHWKLCVVLTA